MYRSATRTTPTVPTCTFAGSRLARRHSHRYQVIHLYSPQLDYSAGIFSKAGESRPRLRQNGLNFRPSLLRHLKYASISAFLIFDGTTILLRFGSQKFVPPYFLIRRSTNLQIDCRLREVSARQVGKYGEPNRNRFDFCLPPIKLSSKKLRNLWTKMFG